MLLQLILFNPRLLQEIGCYNYHLVDICFSIMIGGEASCQKAIEGAEVFVEDIYKFFSSITCFLKTNVTRCNLVSYLALFGIL